MPQVVGVQFQPVTRIYHFDPGGYTDLLPGEWVLVDTVRGRELAQIVLPAHEVDRIEGELKMIVRPADARDLEQRKLWQGREEEAMQVVQRKTADHKLKMKLVRCSYSYNGRRLLVEYVADKRVDFRALVKDLAQHFGARIEMRQIGVRDQAKYIGGFGKCGRDLCCSAFLRDFHSVTIKMAKNQNLPLNPSDISGTCGRLLCSLAYEEDMYTEARRSLPRQGQKVETPQGQGLVRQLNILMQRVTVELEETGSRVELAAADLNVPGDPSRRFGSEWYG
ncbi:MAG: stage 0 sporulation protein [Caldilineales bacterium]|nr:stage 0 sporulation protein [Caldilineales bacterium]